MSSTIPIPTERAAKIVKEVRQQWLRSQIIDSTLHPIVWLALTGLLVLAWVFQPTKTDPTLTTLSLMFLRFVPAFIVFGSICGRTGTGAVVGICLFFVLLGLESLSILTWEVSLSGQSAWLVPHAAWLTDALYVLGLVCLLVCGVTTFMLRREKNMPSKRYVKRCLLLLLILQFALIVDLTYTGLRMVSN